MARNRPDNTRHGKRGGHSDPESDQHRRGQREFDSDTNSNTDNNVAATPTLTATTLSTPTASPIPTTTAWSELAAEHSAALMWQAPWLTPASPGWLDQDKACTCRRPGSVHPGYRRWRAGVGRRRSGPLTVLDRRSAPDARLSAAHRVRGCNWQLVVLNNHGESAPSGKSHGFQELAEAVTDDIERRPRRSNQVPDPPALQRGRGER